MFSGFRVIPQCSLSSSPSLKMLRRSSISLSKSLSRHPLTPSPKPTYPIFPKPLTTLSPQFPSHQNPKKTHLFPQSQTPNSPTQLRYYSVDTNKIVDIINLKFSEAREEIESAMDSKETVYFDEEAECARDAVKEVLDLYEGLLGKLAEKERMGIQRSMGLKIEQLKAELEQLNE